MPKRQLLWVLFPQSNVGSLHLNGTSSNKYRQVISSLSEDQVGHTAEGEGEHFAPQAKCAMLPVTTSTKKYSFQEGAMKIAVGSDERTNLTDTVIAELKQRGHDLILFGPLAENDTEVDWPLVSSRTTGAVAAGKADEGMSRW